VDKPLTVLSLNGYSATTIQGAWDPMPPVSTFTGGTGPLAVRCAWLTKGATLMGFTVQGGATRSSGSINAISGGGVFCSSSDSLVANCIVISNRASSYGGGVAYGTINTSFLENNLAYSGGGAYFATLKNCTIFNNYLTSSTSSSLAGSGIYDSVAYNCILTANYDSSGFTHNWNSDPSTQLAYCCTTPLPSGVGNINSATSGPVFLDLVHIAANCACRSAGSALYATGVDIDGEPWANQPSVGCDEVIDANLVGPLATTIFAWLGTNGVVSKALGFNGIVTGRASRISWSVDGGPIFTNGSWALFNAWTNPGTYNVSFTAYNADNPGGVTTNVTVVISPIYQPLLQSVLSTNNAPQFTFPMQNSVLYRILATTNLTPPVTWTTLSTLFGSGDVATFTDQSATNFPTRFYQVQAQ
jgi:hypothetical protein